MRFPYVASVACSLFQHAEMALQADIPSLPSDLEAVFGSHGGDHEALLRAFMPVFCDHVQADRIFLQPRNPETRVCKVFRWRRNESIPW